MSHFRNQRGPSLMQVAAAIINSAAAAQDVRPHCPVVSGPCPGNVRGVICSSSCAIDEQTPQCRDPHCPDVGHLAEVTCPPEHAEAWRFDFKAPDHLRCGHAQVAFWSGAHWVHPMDMGVCDRPPEVPHA